MTLTGTRTPLRVLFVEDSAADAELMRHTLAAGGYEVTSMRVDTADSMRAALTAHPWDLVLSDYSMPGFGGQAALKLLRSLNTEIPFVIVSGTIGEETAVEALKAGANDFLVKGRLARLLPALERELREAKARRERQILEEQLRQSQARAAFALEAADAGIWDIDLATDATRWCERVSQMFGLPAKPVATNLSGFREHIHPDDLAMMDMALSQSIDLDAPYRVEYRAACPDGTVRWLASKGRVTRAAGGAPIGMMGITIDVTDRKNLEQQLQHAQKMESLGQFAGGIAHDFNNVLTAIDGFSTLLLDDLDAADPRTADVLEIRNAADIGQRLLRQLLAFSRQEPIEPAPLDLNASIATTAGMLQQLLGKRVRLESILDPGAHVWADAGQIEQILVNLAANARDAMPAGGQFRIETRLARVNAWVATLNNVRAGDYVVLAVSDTGTGMSPDVQSRIFEPFFTTKRPGKGTGFGLATVYAIVRQSNGFMHVTSVVDHGTTFRIYFPRLDQSSPSRQ